jgi:copper chaperone CopZ
MTCEHCRVAVTEEVTQVAGVASVDVDLAGKLVRVHGMDVNISSRWCQPPEPPARRRPARDRLDAARLEATQAQRVADDRDVSEAIRT